MNRCASVVFSGGSGQCPVAIDFDELAAGAEQQHRPELGINAASENEFVTLEPHHPLHGDAKKRGRVGSFADGNLHTSKCVANRISLSRFSATPPTSVLWVIVFE